MLLIHHLRIHTWLNFIGTRCLSFFIIYCLLATELNSQDIPVTEQTGIESEISIAVNPNNPDEIIVASMGSNSPIIIYNSVDQGITWNQTSFGNGIADPVLTYGDNNTAYLTYLDFGGTLEMSLDQSIDNGQTWNGSPLVLDGLAADRQWIKRDNSSDSPYYGNIYISYFHPEGQPDIQLVKVDDAGNVGSNHSIQANDYPYVQNPALDIANDGTIVICFVSEDEDGARKIRSVHSTDGSDNFSTESVVTDIFMFNNGNPVTDVIGFAPGDASRLGNSLQMAIDKSTGPFQGRVYLTWTDFVANDPEEGMNVYLSVSDDQGQTWSAAKVVNDDNVASTHQYYSGIDVNSNGVLCLSWYDRRSDPVNDALTDFYFTQSDDGGENFVPSQKINSVSSDHTAVTDGLVTFGVGEYTSLASSAEHAYVVWSDGRNNDGDMDVYFAKVSLTAPNNIEELALSPEILISNLYPNPLVGAVLNLQINTTKSKNIVIEIKDSSGKSCLNVDKKISAGGQHQFSLELGNLPPGNYFVKVKGGNEKMASRKFVISR